MFSPERIIHGFLKQKSLNYMISRKEKKSIVQINLSWQKLFKEFFCTIYFQNHL